MSKAARVTIAIVTLIGGSCFVLCGLAFGHEAPAGPLPFYGLAAFCFVIATACLSRRSRPATLPIIAVAVVAVLWLANRDGAITTLAAVGAVLGAVLLVGVSLYLYVRWRDRVWLRAVRLFRAGDSEGAVAWLQEDLQQAGPSAPTCNTLAALYGAQQRWEEALRMAEEAERVGGPQSRVLNNKGMALWKLGRSQEALAHLQEAARRQPD